MFPKIDRGEIELFLMKQIDLIARHFFPLETDEFNITLAFANVT